MMSGCRVCGKTATTGGRKTYDTMSMQEGRSPHIHCHPCHKFLQLLAGKVNLRFHPRQPNNRSGKKASVVYWSANDARPLFNQLWVDLDTRLLNNPEKHAEIATYLSTPSNKSVYQGIDGIYRPPISIDSLIEELGNNKSHDKFLRELWAIDGGPAQTLEEKLDLLVGMMGELNLTGQGIAKELNLSWLKSCQMKMCDAKRKQYKLELFEKKNAEFARKIEKFMKLGPDMPSSLANAMARNTIPQAEAAQIFRDGWHQEPLTTKIMDELLTGKLNFENASWMQQNVNHERMIQAILEGEMDLDVAKHLLNIGFGDNPLATAAILDGNDIELVASMYGIVLPVVEEVVEEEPEVEVEPEPEKEDIKQWGGRFDQD